LINLLTAVYPDVLPKKLLQNLPKSLLPQLSDIVGSVDLTLSFEWGSPERVAIGKSYDETFRILLIVGTCCQAASLISTLFMKDLNLKTLDETRDYGGMVVGKIKAVGITREQVRSTQNGESAAKEVSE
jgi:hypothetical protein